MKRIWASDRARRFRAFLGASAVGLAIDLIGFQLLITLGLQPWLANGISSLASISAVYLLATRYAFGADARVWTYIAFVAWYTLSIITFSTLIQLATSATDLPPFAWKLMTIPISFTANYLFSRLLFRGRGGLE